MEVLVASVCIILAIIAIILSYIARSLYQIIDILLRMERSYHAKNNPLARSISSRK